MEEQVSRMTDVLQQTMSLYEDNLKNRFKLSGKQVLFVDDSQEMLSLIDIMLRSKFNLLEGYIIEPNPIFAKHTLDWLISKDISINDLIKYAILDVDFGIYNKDVSVNDLIKLFKDNNVPVILFSGMENDTWKKYVKEEYHSYVKFISKLDIHAINKIYTIITEKEASEAKE
jgi:hypothetical protein